MPPYSPPKGGSRTPIGLKTEGLPATRSVWEKQNRFFTLNEGQGGPRRTGQDLQLQPHEAVPDGDGGADRPPALGVERADTQARPPRRQPWGWRRRRGHPGTRETRGLTQGMGGEHGGRKVRCFRGECVTRQPGGPCTTATHHSGRQADKKHCRKRIIWQGIGGIRICLHGTMGDGSGHTARKESFLLNNKGNVW